MRALSVPLMLALSALGLNGMANAKTKPRPANAASTRPVIAPPRTVGNLPMDLSSGRPRISGSLNSGPIEEIEFDTGSDGPALIQRAHADRMKLPVVGEQALASPYANAAPIKAKLVRLDSVTVGGFTAKNVTAIVMDDASFIGADAPLIIGPHQFPDHIVTLDYPRGEFSLSTGGPSGGKGWQKGGKSGYLQSTMTIGEIRIPLHIDSGGPAALMLPKGIANRLKDGMPLQPIGAMRTVDREIPMFLGDVDQDANVVGVPVRIGKTIFADIPYANLGSQGLRAFRVVIDNPRRRWRLEATSAEKPLLETRPMRRPAGG